MDRDGVPVVQDQLDFVFAYERNVALPLKIAMILVCFALTLSLDRSVLYESSFYNGYIFFILISFLFVTLYSFQEAFSRRYIQWLSYLSFAHDIAFVAFLLRFTGGTSSILNYVFPIFFVRAAVNYPTVKGILVAGFGIFTPIYVGGLLWAHGSGSFLTDLRFLSQYALLLGVIVSCFGVVSLMNRKQQQILDHVREISSLQQQLIQAEKLAGVGQLAGGVAHELNNPLGSILGFAQMLLADTPVDDPRKKDLERVERAAVRCKKIIDSLLSFSRQSRADFQQMSVHEAIEEPLNLCQYQMERAGVEVEKAFLSELPAIMGDPAQLQQVFMNLFLNALDAMPDGGRIKITTARERSGAQEVVTVSVSDTGCGIPPEILAKIFDPFFTTKDVGKGTGLGLSIVYGIIQRHGGTIEVKSRKGEGTEFIIRLPVARVEQPKEPVHA